MINNNPANTGFPVSDLIQNRWSPLAFSNDPIGEDVVSSLLEAARWAPSSFNEQPWSYVVGYKGDETHAKLSDCLAEGNAWAKEVPVLMLSVSKSFFDHKHRPNRHSMHDTGMASALLVLQATAMDLASHQMAGFDLERARAHFSISEDYEPGSMIAIGKMGERSLLADDLREREEAPRQRKNFEDMLWNSAS